MRSNVRIFLLRAALLYIPAGALVPGQRVIEPVQRRYWPRRFPKKSVRRRKRPCRFVEINVFPINGGCEIRRTTDFRQPRRGATSTTTANRGGFDRETKQQRYRLER